MMIDEVRARCAIQNKNTSFYGNPQFDLGVFRGLDVPALCIGLPPATVFVVIAADGSLTLIEQGRIVDDFENECLTGYNILVNAAAQTIAVDFAAALNGLDHLVPLVGSFLGSYCLLEASKGARVELGVEAGADLESVAQAASSRGGKSERINTQLERIGAALSDPFFVPKDEEKWEADSAADLEAVVFDILASDPDFDGGFVDLRGPLEDECATIEGDLSDTSANRVLAILRIIVDLDYAFVGTVWEYNDGASSRRSGYYPMGSRLFDAEVDPASEHERLAAWQRLHDRLAAKGKSPEEIRTLLKG